jgi:hypothetical protein
MTHGDFTGAAERLAVAVSAPLREYAIVQTSFNVKRWDVEQTEWALRKIDRDAVGWLRRGRDVTISAETFARLGVAPYSETQDDNCNAVVQSGWVAILGSIAGTSIATKFSASAGRIGAGTVSTAVTWGDAHLGGDGNSTTAWYKLVSGAPSISTGSGPATLTFSATFGTSAGNFAWAEFGTDNGASDSNTVSGVFLNHGISSQGTKASGQTWTATETLSFGFPSGDGTVNAVGP